MRLPGDEDTSDVEDRRGGGFRSTGTQLGLGGTIVVLLLSFVFRQNLFSALGVTPGGGEPSSSAPGEASARKQQEAALERVAVAAFNDAQRVWAERLPGRYRKAKLVLFWDRTHSPCGSAGAEMGPFYCPGDEKVYIDLGFYRELRQRFGAPGDFAQAYVIAHEVGHHVQTVVGTEPKVRAEQRRHPGRANELSVRMELQADCLAGVWAKSTAERALLEHGDLEEALGAAAAVGDDRLQKAATGQVHPESWTHGSARQRASWFRRGFDAGRLEACDTFAPR